jgi:hypothetical protein
MALRDDPVLQSVRLATGHKNPGKEPRKSLFILIPGQEEHKRQMNHLEHSIEALYETSLKKLKRREEDIHHKTMVIWEN